MIKIKKINVRLQGGRQCGKFHFVRLGKTSYPLVVIQFMSFIHLLSFLNVWSYRVFLFDSRCIKTIAKLWRKILLICLRASVNVKGVKDVLFSLMFFESVFKPYFQGVIDEPLITWYYPDFVWYVTCQRFVLDVNMAIFRF